MDRITTLLSRVTELSDEELRELEDLVSEEFDAVGSDPAKVMGVNEAEQLESLAAAAQLENEVRRREDPVLRSHEATRVLPSFGTEPFTPHRRGVGERVQAAPADQLAHLAVDDVERTRRGRHPNPRARV